MTATKITYVLARREPHGEVIDTYIMAAGYNAADIETFIYDLSLENSFINFNLAINYYDTPVEEAKEFAAEAMKSYAAQCVIFPVITIE